VTDKGRCIVHAGWDKIEIQPFPSKIGWYKTDRTSGIPVDESSVKNENARYLSRDWVRVGPIIRGRNYGDNRFVFLGGDFSPASFGLLVENTQEDELKRVRRVATFAAPELRKLMGTMKPEQIENLRELVEILTGQ
jgi:hypothetical protein